MLTRDIDRLTGVTHKDAITTFGDFIDYCLWMFGVPFKNWKYKEGVGKEFFKAFSELIREYGRGINHSGWCDPLGDCFMELIKGVAKYRGQYFTPAGLCTLMADITTELVPSNKKYPCGVYGFRELIGDPTCGSGRNLLASKATFDEASEEDQPYFIGEDIDTLCCKMTAINMCVHGCYGEVICHDTLTEPDKVRFGYVINVGLRYYSTPGIQYSEDPRMFASTTFRRFIPKPAAKAAENPKVEKQPKAIKSKPKEPVELDLFGDNY